MERKCLFLQNGQFYPKQGSEGRDRSRPRRPTGRPGQEIGRERRRRAET